MELEDFGKTLHGTRDDNWGPAVRRIDALKPAVEFNGRARMKGAEHLFWSIESAEGNDLRGIPSDIPSRHYFGRVVAASAARAGPVRGNAAAKRTAKQQHQTIEIDVVKEGATPEPLVGAGREKRVRKKN